MTSKIYKTAQGKSVDLGTIILKNEHVRAVGNMNVNARGDVVDNANRVIETKPQLIQRQNARLTNVSTDPVQSSSGRTKKVRTQTPPTTPVTVVDDVAEDILAQAEEETLPPPLAEPLAQDLTTTTSNSTGLAGAIARTREIKQELEKTRRQQQQAQGVRKL